MCGICGKIGRRNPSSGLYGAMEALAHRGPDQEGAWRQGSVALGHRRLSIIDLSEDGRQPMSNEDGRIRLVFNGEIYNFTELRRSLEERHRFRSRTDSEVLVHGYEEWGIEGLVERIRGMFAFGLWDDSDGVLHLVRDHLGKKPLYYSAGGGEIAFASTLPALLRLLGTTPEVSRQALVEYLAYTCVPAPRSIFEGVYKLPPAHRLEFRAEQGSQVYRYWRPDFSQKEDLSEEEWVARTEEALIKAIQERLVADVPLGSFLSGGIDSSLVVALMASVCGQPVTTISMGFEEEGFNELPHARRVAEAFATDHHEHVLRPDAASTLPDLVYHYGEPFADHSALPTFYLAEAARQHVKVVLTGDGGDETFGGYHTTAAMALAHRARWVPGMASGRLASIMRQLEVKETSLSRKLRWVAELGRGPNGNYVFDPIGARTFRFYDEGLFGPALRDLSYSADGDRLYRELWAEAGDVGWVDHALYVDLMAYLPNDLLAKSDVATMAHGLEARSPFLDKRIVELACSIPAKVKLKGLNPKHLLKKLAAKHLPEELLSRRKQGFSLPVSRWLRQDLAGVVDGVLLSDTALRRGYFQPAGVRRFVSEHRSGKADHGRRLWLLLMLELWFRMFVDAELSRSDSLASMVSEPTLF